MKAQVFWTEARVNVLIDRMVLGETLRGIGATYGVSGTRIASIFNRECELRLHWHRLWEGPQWLDQSIVPYDATPRHKAVAVRQLNRSDFKAMRAWREKHDISGLL